MTLRARAILAAAALTVVCAIGWSSWQLYGPASEARARELLQAAARALHHTSVQGQVLTRVRVGQQWRQARAEVHRGGGRARVRYLDGPAAGTTIFRQGRDVWAERQQGQPLRRVDLPEDPVEALARHLARDGVRSRVRGEGMVAGRPVLMIEVGGQRGHLQLGVDRQTSFPLLMERYDADGQLRVSTVYEHADFSAPPPPPAQPPEGAQRRRFGGERFERLDEVKNKVSFTLYQPTYVPKGFELKGGKMRPGELVAVRYSDDLNWILLLQRPSDAQHHWPEGASHRGRARERDGRDQQRGLHQMRGPRGMMHLPGGPMGEAIRRSMDGTVVLVMGSLPREELARVADSLQPLP